MVTTSLTGLTVYVGFWRRASAFLVDMLWLTPISLLFIASLYKAGYIGSVYYDASLEWQQAYLLSEILAALMIIWFWVRYAATPGKMLFYCEIVDAKTGKPITSTQALLRYIGYIISFLFLGLGIIWIAFDKRKQGWHDKIAGTVVIIHDQATIPLYKLEKYYR